MHFAVALLITIIVGALGHALIGWIFRARADRDRVWRGIGSSQGEGTLADFTRDLERTRREVEDSITRRVARKSAAARLTIRGE